MNEEIQKKLARLSPEKREILLKELKKRKQQQGQNQPTDEITPVERKSDLLQLSFSQQRLWFLDQLEGQNPTYNMPAVLAIQGQLDETALEQALNKIIERHEILRTEFVTEEGKGYQRVLPSLIFEIEKLDLSLEPNAEEILQQRIREQIHFEFCLSNAPLFRCCLIRQGEDRWTLVICMHHIISDGWSSSILIGELSSFYRAIVEQKALPLPPLNIQYADYAHWQREKLQGEFLETQLKFWREELQHLPNLELPTDYPRPARQSHQGKRYFFNIDEEVGDLVNQSGKRNNATPFNVFLAVFEVLLFRYTGQSDFALGTPVANRPQSSLEPLIGFFVNTLTLRSRLEESDNFDQLIKKVQSTSQRAIEHQQLPFEKLVDDLGVERNMSQSPLFQVMFVFQNTSKNKFDLPGLSIDFVEAKSESAKFDLSLTINNDNGIYSAEWEYASDLFNEDSIRRLTKHFNNLAQQLLKHPDHDINKIDYLDNDEKKQILLDWNNSEYKPQTDIECIHQIFQQKAQQFADSDAVSYEGETLSYQLLNQRANQFARYLISNGVEKNDLVGLSLERSIEMIVSILAILKAGAAYVPIDPNTPAERMKFIFSDSAIKTLLVDSASRGTEFGAVTVLNIEAQKDIIARQDKNNIDIAVSADSVAYVIYTSGTTGKPKGVQIPHKNVARLFSATEHWFDFNEKDTWTFFHSFAFDFSVWEIWGALFYGGRLLIVPHWLSRSPKDFHQLLLQQKVTVLNQTPSAFNQLISVDAELEARQPYQLRYVIFGGEALDTSTLKTWVSRYGYDYPQLINMYGITETTVHVTYHRLSADDLQRHASNVGRPIPDLNLYILDKHQNPVPIGVNGEIYVGGAGVAKAYLNRAELNQQRFINLSFSPLSNERVYRSGDLGRYMANGDIEYLGRIDNQVKVRGFRIELGEIEHALKNLDTVQDSVVLVEENPQGLKQLVAYLIGQNNYSSDEFDISNLRAALQRTLPDYMVPAQFYIVDGFPLTINGKLDSKKLSEMGREGIAHGATSSANYLAPSTDTEKALVGIWEKILGLEKVGINDNFFELGGDSILTIQIVSAAKRLGLTFSAKQVFENQTIAELARVVNVENIQVLAEQGPVVGECALSPIQKWFFNQPLAAQNYWHQSVLLKCERIVSPSTLCQAIEKVFLQHDGLRLTFQLEENNIQAEHRNFSPEQIFKQYKIAEKNQLPVLTERIQNLCSLQQGPLIQFALIEGPSSPQPQNWLFIAAHHLVVDGVSWRILLADLNESLTSLDRGESVELGLKTSSFKQYSNCFRDTVAAGFFNKQIDYWQEQHQGQSARIPIDNPNGNNTYSQLEFVEINFSRQQTDDLLRQVNQSYGTETEEILLACLTRALCHWADCNSITVDLEHHGRDFPAAEIDVSRSVGWFTSIYPQKFNNHGLWQDQILHHKEKVRNIPNHGLGFAAIKYLAEKQLADVLAFVKSEVLFNYLGQFDSLQQESEYFSLAEENTAPNMAATNPRAYELEISLVILGDTLRASFQYSGQRFKKDNIQYLAASFKQAIEDCLHYCCRENNFAYSPSDFPLLSLTNDQLSQILDPITVNHGKRQIEGLYPLSPMQQGILFHHLYDPDSSLYHEQLSVAIKGRLSAQHLRAAFQQTLDNHPILRTSFLYSQDEQALQLVYKNRVLSFAAHKIREKRKENLIAEYLQQDLTEKFELSSEELFRVQVLEFDNDDFQLIVSFHHILLDGWSLGLVLSEAFTRYQALVKNSDISLPKPPRYEKFIHHLKQHDVEAEKQYWQNYLADFSTTSVIPGDLVDGRASVHRKSLRQHFMNDDDVALVSQIESYAKENHLTVNTLFQAAWSILLSRLNGDEQVIYGVTVAGRPAEIPHVENIAGLFINTLPLMVNLDNYDKDEWLQALQTQQLELRKYENSALADIQRYCNLKQQNLFDTIFVYENYPIDENLKREALELEFGEVQSEWRTNFPITFVVTPAAEMELRISYDPGLYSRAYIEEILRYYRIVLQQLVTPSVSDLRKIKLISAQQKQILLSERNQTRFDYPRNSSISQLFEEAVKHYASKTAVRDRQRSLNYQQLNNLANQYARLLKDKGVVRKQFVAICADRGIETIAAIIGVLKLGAAYVPLDGSYPRQRLQYMLEDSGATILLVSEKYQSLFKQNRDFSKLELVDLHQPLEKIGTENLNLETSAEDLAYAMYTSGSTGQPKGIAIGNRNVVRLVKNSNFLDFNEHKVFLQFAPISFDASTLELWGPLLNGGELVIAEQDLDLDQLGQLIQTTGVNTLWLTAALFHYLAEFNIDSFSALTTLLAGGDVLQPSLVKKVLQRFTDIVVVNGYGPTENTTFTCCHVMGQADQVGKNVAIGKPVANTQVYILDNYLNPVPDGMIGELYTAGDGVALEYINQPELTAKSFIANPYAAEYGHGETLYKTGDLARYRSDGLIEYVGRHDQQVKIRGFRIELGEIEECLLGLDSVAQVAVVAHNDKNNIKRLVAYLVKGEAQATPAAEDLRDHVLQHLPEYMVPASFIYLSSLPVTANGKLDRRALPEPEFGTLGDKNNAPRNDVEAKLCEIWAQVLGVQTVGIHDNYFELGGDSILSIQILSRAKRAGLLITAKQIFELQNIGKIAQVAKQGQTLLADQGLVKQDSLITPIQQWFFELPLKNPQRWNMSVQLKLNISDEFNQVAQCLNLAAREIVNQHDYLRSNFRLDRGVWSQYHQPRDLLLQQEIFFQALDYSQSSETKENILQTWGENAQGQFTFDHGPLVRFVYLRLPDGEDRLLCVAHHLLIDGVSWRIILEDLETLIHQYLNDGSIDLGEKTTSVAQWSRCLNEFANKQNLAADLEYWSQLSDHGVVRLSVLSGEEHRVADSVEIGFSLDAQQTQQLLSQANQAYKTEINDLLLTALVQALSAQCGAGRCLLHMEGHGREHLADNIDISRTVGWFTSLFPLVLELPQQDSIAEQIKAVKQQLRELPRKGFSYGMVRYSRSSSITETEAYKKIHQLEKSSVAFNYLGQTDNLFEQAKYFQAVSEAMGAERDPGEQQPYPLDIYGLVTEGEMRFGLRFSPKQLSTEFVQSLANSFETALQEIIKHCLNDKNRGFVKADFPLLSLSQSQIDHLTNQYPELDDIYPLSPLQQGMLFHALLDEQSGVYFEQHCFNVEGEENHFNEEKLISAWQKVIAKHEILRTLFLAESVDNPALQVVLKQVHLPFYKLNLSEAESDSYLQEDRAKGFDFAASPLMRLTLIDHGNGKQKLVWSFHHILLDGWSVSLVMADVFQTYEASLRGEAYGATAPQRYGDYITWLSQQPEDEAREFWRSYMQGISAPTELAMKSSHRLTEKTNQVNPIYDIQFDSSLQQQMVEYCKSQGITTNTLFQAAWGLMLSEYSAEQEVVFGVTVSGRPADIPGVESMVGLFINTLPLRLNIDKQMSVSQWLQQLQAQQLQTRQYEYMPLFEISRISDMAGDQPLFESLLVFENYPVSEALNEQAYSLQVASVDSVEQTNYPLTLIVLPGQQLTLRFSYASQWFNEAIIQRISRQFSYLLNQLIQADTELASISLLNEQDQHKVFEQWQSKTLNHRYGAASVTEVILEQGRKNPQNLALWDDQGGLSYQQMLQQAYDFACYLKQQGVQGEDLVAVCCSRRKEIFPLLLGIHWLGAAYVPIDHSYPQERIEYMLQDSSPKVVVMEQSSRVDSISWLAQSSIHSVILEQWLGDKADHTQTKQIDFALIGEEFTTPKAEQLAYVIYTSGSTGKPKGVMIEHRGLKNLAEWSTQEFALAQNSRCTQMAGFGFDACVWEVWPALMAGASVHVVNDEIRLDPMQLAEFINQQRISHSFMPTPLAENFIQLAIELPSLKVLLTGGDQLTLRPKQALGYALYNQYGPTESAVVATSAKVQAADTLANDTALALPSIGSVIGNLELYLLDANLKPVGIGVPGELHIGGVGLARAYLNQKELTAEKFITIKLAKQKPVRVYKTGDLVRYTEQGELEFLGRIDQQVKIRGFRIELGEIESVILQNGEIKECVVQAWQNERQQKYLAAYVVPATAVATEQEQEALINELMVGLKSQLPSYMVPTAMAVMTALPITANGKIDRAALPKIENYAADKEFIAPSSDIEKQLAQIWQDVLAVDRVGIHDDFFELGGHSIVATKVHTRMRENMALDIPLRTLFEVSTIAELAQLIDTLSNGNQPDLVIDDDEEFEEGTL